MLFGKSIPSIFWRTFVGTNYATSPVERKKIMRTKIKNIALFFAAPFIGLVYIATLPIVGIGALAYLGGKAILNA